MRVVGATMYPPTARTSTCQASATFGLDPLEQRRRGPPRGARYQMCIPPDGVRTRRVDVSSQGLGRDR
ncbi:hypothetical protein GCM10020254_01270 [Streptomyces goshikiensis]